MGRETLIASFVAYSRSGRLYAACILFSLIVGTVSAFQVNSEKVIRANDPAQITDAVMITDITVDGKSVDCGLFVRPDFVQPVVSFQAGSDWLRKTTITLINRTAKAIVAGAITLNFLDTGDCHSQACASAHIWLGKIPAIDAYDGRTGQPLSPEQQGREALDWKPSQTIEIRLADYLDKIEAESGLSSYLPVSSVSSIAVHLSAFFFQDGMRWSVQGYSVPDLDHAGKYKILSPNYFPGRRGQNWPPGYNQ